MQKKSVLLFSLLLMSAPISAMELSPYYPNVGLSEFSINKSSSKKRKINEISSDSIKNKNQINRRIKLRPFRFCIEENNLDWNKFIQTYGFKKAAINSNSNCNQMHVSTSDALITDNHANSTGQNAHTQFKSTQFSDANNFVEQSNYDKIVKKIRKIKRISLSNILSIASNDLKKLKDKTEEEVDSYLQTHDAKFQICCLMCFNTFSSSYRAKNVIGSLKGTLKVHTQRKHNQSLSNFSDTSIKLIVMK